MQKVLSSEPEFHGSLGAAANWADRQGRTPLTKGWHYIDALDKSLTPYLQTVACAVY